MHPPDPDNPWPDPAEPDLFAGGSPFPDDPPAEPEEAEEVAASVSCWRCGLVEPPVAGKCRRCAARIADEEDDWRPDRRRAAAPAGGETGHLGFVLLFFGLFLLTSVIWGWVLLRSAPRMTEEEMLVGMGVVEGIDTVLALVVLARVGRAPLPARTAGARVAAWLVAVPALLLLLAANVAYATFLKELIRPGAQPMAPPITVATVLLICVQPALIEELFFRYVAFGAVERSTGIHTTVWVTSVMFAAAHIYNPLGMPYLFLVGVVLGYARVWGGLALPMVLHFCHNLAVLALEGVG